jgi:putative transposase
MSFSMNQLYQSVSISKQAVHQYANYVAMFDNRLAGLQIEVDALRREHPGCGVEKMYEALKPDFIGRDRFVELLMALGYRVGKEKNPRRTTFAGKIYYPNLIKGLRINRPLEVWQSDITFIDIGGQFCYGVFILDVYTREIVGYKISNHMRVEANMFALSQAFKKFGAPRYHHSDRGSQYSALDYTSLLKSKGSKISMGLTSQDNAYVERINRTIKEEYIRHWKPTNLAQLRRMVSKAVNHYNTKRSHKALGLPPSIFSEYWQSCPDEEKPVMTIFNKDVN